MVMTWIATDENGNITAGSTNEPTRMIFTGMNPLPSDGAPNYQHSFDLSWEQVNTLHLYKVENSELVLK